MVYGTMIEEWIRPIRAPQKHLVIQTMGHEQMLEKNTADMYREDVELNSVCDERLASPPELDFGQEHSLRRFEEQETGSHLIGSPVEPQEPRSVAQSQVGFSSLNPSTLERLSTAEFEECVEKYYYYILNRAPDPSGLNHHVAQLSRGLSKFDLAVHLLFSDESLERRRTSAELAESVLHVALREGPLDDRWRGLLQYLAENGDLTNLCEEELLKFRGPTGRIIGCAKQERDGSVAGWAINADLPYAPVEITVQAESAVELVQTVGAPAGILFRTRGNFCAFMPTKLRATAGRTALPLVLERSSIVDLLEAKLANDRRWLWDCVNSHNASGPLTHSSPLDLHKRSGDPAISDFMLYAAAKHLSGNFDLSSPTDKAKLLEWYVNDFREQWDPSTPFPISETLALYLQAPALAQGISPTYMSRLLFLFWKRRFGGKELLFDKEYNRWLVYKLVSSPNAGTAAFLKACGDRLLQPLLLRHPHSSKLPIPRNWYWYFALSEEFGNKNLEEVAPLDYLAATFRKLYYALASGNHLRLIPDEWLEFWRHDNGSGLGRAERLIERLLVSNGSSTELIQRWLVDVFFVRYPQFQILKVENRLGESSKLATDTARGMVEKRQELSEHLYIVGHTSQTGLGANFWMSVEAFRSAGVEPVIGSVDQPRIELETATAGTATKLKRPIVLFHVNADRVPLELARLPQSLQQKAYRIGFFLWETSVPPATHLLGLDLMDEIWVPTEYVAEIYRRYTNNPVINVRKGLKAPERVMTVSRASLGIDENDFVFLTIGDFHSSIARKNPLAVVQAFRTAFSIEKNVKLLLKVKNIDYEHWSNRGRYWNRVEEILDGDERVKILDKDMSYPSYWGLIQAIDCYVSLHKSEGFGYGLAHSMLMKKPVIASDFSGSRDFCTHETAFLVPTKEVLVGEHEMPINVPGATCGEPDLSVAADQMQKVFADSQRRHNTVRRAFDLISEKYSVSELSSTYLKRLSQFLF